MNDKFAIKFLVIDEKNSRTEEIAYTKDYSIPRIGEFITIYDHSSHIRMYEVTEVVRQLTPRWSGAGPYTHEPGPIDVILKWIRG